MRVYTIEIWFTDELEPRSTEVRCCEEVAIRVRAKDQDQALELAKSVLEDGEWESRRVLEYDVQEAGPWEDGASSEILSHPIRQELNKIEPWVKRLRSWLGHED